jgi:hypothetical protein
MITRPARVKRSRTPPAGSSQESVRQTGADRSTNPRRPEIRVVAALAPPSESIGAASATAPTTAKRTIS